MLVKEARLDALVSLLGEDDGPQRGKKARLAKRIRKSPAQVSQWLSGYRTIDDETARAIEDAAGKPKWWMDGADKGSEVVRPACTVVARPSIESALAVVLDALAACQARTELRQLLPMLIDTNAPAYRQRLTELLSAAPASLGAPIAPEHDDRLRQMAERAEEEHARRNTPTGAQRRRTAG